MENLSKLSQCEAALLPPQLVPVTVPLLQSGELVSDDTECSWANQGTSVRPLRHQTHIQVHIVHVGVHCLHSQNVRLLSSQMPSNKYGSVQELFWTSQIL